MEVIEYIQYILAVYSWVVIGLLVAFLWRIAYFYEKTSGQCVGYYFLVIPSLLLAAGVTWYLVTDVEFVGQPIGDLLLFSGGVLLGLFGFGLQEFMIGERR